MQKGQFYNSFKCQMAPNQIFTHILVVSVWGFCNFSSAFPNFILNVALVIQIAGKVSIIAILALYFAQNWNVHVQDFYIIFPCLYAG